MRVDVRQAHDERQANRQPRVREEFHRPVFLDETGRRPR